MKFFYLAVLHVFLAVPAMSDEVSPQSFFEILQTNYNASQTPNTESFSSMPDGMTYFEGACVRGYKEKNEYYSYKRLFVIRKLTEDFGPIAGKKVSVKFLDFEWNWHGNDNVSRHITSALDSTTWSKVNDNSYLVTNYISEIQKTISYFLRYDQQSKSFYLHFSYLDSGVVTSEFYCYFWKQL